MPAPRAFRHLTLGFGVVQVPIAIKPLLAAGRPPSATTLCPVHDVKVSMAWFCPEGHKGEGHYLQNAEKKSGYEIPGHPGEYVTLDEEVLDELVADKTGEVAIERVVPVAEFDPLYVDRTYVVWADEGGPTAQAGFDALAGALREKGSAAVASAVVGKQTQMFVLRWSDVVGTLVMHVCHFDSNVRWDDVALVRQGQELRGEPNPAVVAQAGMLLDTLAGEFDPQEVDDVYGSALEEAILVSAGKMTRKPKKVVADAPASTADDLLAALTASVEQAQTRKATAPKKASRSRAKVAA